MPTGRTARKLALDNFLFVYNDRFAFIGWAEVNDNIEIGSLISRSWFSYGFYTLVELEFVDVGFCGERKTGEPREKPS